VKRQRAISLDADLLREAELRVGEDEEELAAFVSAALRRELLAHPRGGPSAPPEVLRDHAEEYLQALLARDARRARAAIESAVASGVPIPDVYTDIFEPALADVGHRWAMGCLNVAEEHFATSTTQSLMASLAPAGRTARSGGRLAIVTSAPDELHGLGAQMVADLLEREGWEVLCLGAATPAQDLVELVELECPDLVAISASTAGRMPGVEQVVPRLAALRPRPLIAVGGRLFDGSGAEIARGLGADLVVSDIRALLATLRERFPEPAAEPADPVWEGSGRPG
jgi:methanogenic corrinoid protein MtbC1